MDKNAIKKYAVWARRELIARVTKRAEQYGIAKDNIIPADATSVYERVLSAEEMRQRKALIQHIAASGYEHVMEEVAYTWFNRFIALRYMEVNGFLPSHVRVFTDDVGAFKPQILAEALHLELDGLDMEKVYACKQANKTDELYKYLLITQCNALNALLPGMFQKLADYTELLFPDNILREGSAIEQMIANIPEDDWKDAVQIIGWLYQYYNAEPKDIVFANLKKNIKISKHDIPAATQLFTPDWIVRYMVENSLGRLWLEYGPSGMSCGNANDALREFWRYYLDEAEQEPDVEKQLLTLRADHSIDNPMSIRCIDPCMGSGHILAYLFDVLMQIYEASGYPTREAVRAILENNLYGLDIDDRAAQLAYFAVMMKARQYDRRFFSHITQPHVFAIQESNAIDREQVKLLGAGMSDIERNNAINQMMNLLDALTDAKEYGSILTPDALDWPLLRRFTASGEANAQVSMGSAGLEETQQKLLRLIDVGEALTMRYDVVVTNPPYMGSSGMGAKLAKFVKDNYPDTKSDMSTVFMERTIGMCKQNGYMAMINIPVWMFLSSYEKLRHNLLTRNTISSMVHPGRGIFGSDFGTTSFVIAKNYIKGYTGSYRRLFDKQGEVETIEVREQRFFEGRGCFTACQDNFAKIPGAPVAYWVSENVLLAYQKGVLLGDCSDVKIGMGTGKNDIFVREWWEIGFNVIDFSLQSIVETRNSEARYFPYNKGGEYRLWYGNLQEVLWFNSAGQKKMNTMSGHRENGGHDYYCKEGLTWSFISSSKFGIRYMPNGCFFDVAGSTLFSRQDNLYTLGFLASNVCFSILSILNPTLNYQAGNIKSLPLLFSNIEQVDGLVERNILISKSDWDSFETSWDFERYPLVRIQKNNRYELIANSYRAWSEECASRFAQLKANEEELNRIFIDIYGLQDELTPEVADKDVTVYRVIDVPNAEERAMRYVLSRRDVVVSLISYAVGCMFGRYSLDKPGLLFAGGDWNETYSDFCRHNAVSFAADKDNVLPICDDEYFEDDIVGCFVKFIEVVYGKETLEENLRFIADALSAGNPAGSIGQPKDVIRAYFINNFYADHLKTYQKRPIYWLFDSGKKNGFKALIYIHRYQPDTIARVRTDYVHEQQSRYRTAIADLENRVANASASERVKLTKHLNAVRAQAEELRAYEEKIHHLADQMIRIDLDDGVKVNYAKFADVLATIK